MVYSQNYGTVPMKESCTYSNPVRYGSDGRIVKIKAPVLVSTKFTNDTSTAGPLQAIQLPHQKARVLPNHFNPAVISHISPDTLLSSKNACPYTNGPWKPYNKYNELHYCECNQHVKPQGYCDKKKNNCGCH